jgi:hypothetical protein
MYVFEKQGGPIAQTRTCLAEKTNVASKLYGVISQKIELYESFVVLIPMTGL